MNTHLEPEDLVLYATGAADHAETERIRQHVDSCVPCRGELQRIYGDLGLLGMAADEAGPSLALKQRLMRSIADEEQSRKVPEAKIRKTRYTWDWVAVAALVALVFGLVQQVRLFELRKQLGKADHQLLELRAQSDTALKIVATLKAPDALRLSLVKAGEKPQPQLQAVYAVSQARVVLIANDLAPLPSGKGYELWILPVSGNPIAAGVFHPDEKGHASHTFEFASPVEGKGFAITVEQNEGSDHPTTAPIFVGLKN